MKTILRALLEVVATKPYWKTPEIRSIVLNLIADSEAESLTLPKLSYPDGGPRTVSFTKTQLLDLLQAVHEHPITDIFKYVNTIFGD